MVSYSRIFGFAFAAAVALLIVGVTTSTSHAHSAFKKQMEKDFPNLKVSCNTCHDKKKKSIRSDFGKLFEAEFKGQNLTSTFKSKKGQEKKDYEKKTMIPAYEKAWKKIKAEKEDPKDKDSKTYEEIVKAAEVDGLTEKPKEDDDEDKDEKKDDDKDKDDKKDDKDDKKDDKKESEKKGGE